MPLNERQILDTQVIDICIAISKCLLILKMQMLTARYECIIFMGCIKMVFRI